MNPLARRGDKKIIPLKGVMGLPFLVSRPTYLRVWRWKKYGVGGIRLETYREGRGVFTSEEAVLRFLVRINEGVY